MPVPVVHKGQQRDKQFMRKTKAPKKRKQSPSPMVDCMFGMQKVSGLNPRSEVAGAGKEGFLENLDAPSHQSREYQTRICLSERF